MGIVLIAFSEPASASAIGSTDPYEGDADALKQVRQREAVKVYDTKPLRNSKPKV
ncbi:hypothetical protein HC248_02683 [Polaromonas vacuolata]|uniref:Uncharacterized protein n=1 Tax=Polaromonas vacuolata TaxID=37448 RepID=A0A6H2HBU9_9BURK|nr:hypothetical protein HC248_02683 [Polaromonas vacuolata]